VAPPQHLGQPCACKSITAHNKNSDFDAYNHFKKELNGTSAADIVRCNRKSEKVKMATAKPEVPISQFIEKIATPFKRLTPYFRVQEFNGDIPNTVLRNGKSEIQVGGR
jgi:hypothetical protein